MGKIKIVNIISKLVYGGTESVLLNYYNNIDLSKYEISIITMEAINDEAINRFENLGIHIFKVGDWEKNPIKIGKKILKILKQQQFDIIHSHLSHTNFYFMILGYIAGIKIRISHSHLIYIDKTIKEKIKHKIYKFLIKIFSTNYMACSEAAALDLYGTTKNVYILKNAIDLKKFAPNINIRKEYRKLLKYKDSEIVICNIGRMEEQKNQLFLIDIFKELTKLNSNYRLLIIGSGILDSEIKNKISNLKLKEKVQILSNRDDVNKILQATDIFLLPSLYEGLGIVLVEAQAAGLICYTSDSVVPKEAKVTNYLHYISLEKNSKEWADTITRSYKKSGKRVQDYQSITNNGYNIVEEAKKLDNYYQKVKCNRGEIQNEKDSIY